MGSKSSILVVGAGFAGATAARLLADAGHRVTVIDQRNHIGGNAYDYIDSKTGIAVHHYGPHIFHTSNRRVIDFLSRFTEWSFYEHRVYAQLKNGQLVDFPVNQNTLKYVDEKDIIDIFYKPYSEKMWGEKFDSIDPETIKRVSARSDNEDRYFPKDTFQYMPRQGFTAMFEKMLASPLIEVCLETSWSKALEKSFDHCFSSMSIDQYHDYIHGRLPYRSIKFQSVRVPCNRVFSRSVINFTDQNAYTRVTEWRNFPNNPETNTETILTFELPCDFRENNHERYYPIKNETNLELYRKYKNIETPNVSFIGRCGMYAYLNMDQAVSSTFSVVDNYLKN